MKPCDCDFPREDRRVARTRAQLSGALIELLLERGWEAIGVGELCERANIARSTFYLHYANKEELLESGFAALHDTIRAIAPANSLSVKGQFGFVEGIAEHIFENRRTFLALVGSNGGSIVRERFRALLSRFMTEELGSSRKVDLGLIHFLSGGFVSLAAHAMAAKNTRAKDFATQFHRFANPVLAGG